MKCFATNYATSAPKQKIAVIIRINEYQHLVLNREVAFY